VLIDKENRVLMCNLSAIEKQKKPPLYVKA